MEELHPVQISAYKQMTPSQKLAIADQLWRDAKELKRAWLRQQHPEWSNEQIEEAVREIFLNAGT